MITKSQREARGVPDAATNAAGLRLSRTLLAALGGRPFVDERAVAEEQRWITRETRCLLDNVLRLAEGGSLAAGVLRAFEHGQLDGPVAPSDAVRGRVRPARDRRRAIRFGDYGELPFDAEVRAHNEAELGGAQRPRTAEAELAALARLTKDLMLAAADPKGAP
jgi:methylaspartate mutase epsilon subunit